MAFNFGDYLRVQVKFSALLSRLKRRGQERAGVSWSDAVMAR